MAQGRELRLSVLVAERLDRVVDGLELVCNQAIGGVLARFSQLCAVEECVSGSRPASNEPQASVRKPFVLRRGWALELRCVFAGIALAMPHEVADEPGGFEMVANRVARQGSSLAVEPLASGDQRVPDTGRTAVRFASKSPANLLDKTRHLRRLVRCKTVLNEP